MPHVRLPVYHPDRSAKHRRRSRMLAHTHTRLVQTHSRMRKHTHAVRTRAGATLHETTSTRPRALHAALSPHALWRPRLRAAVVGRPPRARACGCAETAPARRGSAALPPAVSVGRCMLQAAGCMLHVAFCCGRAAARGVRCPLHAAVIQRRKDKEEFEHVASCMLQCCMLLRPRCNRCVLDSRYSVFDHNVLRHGVSDPKGTLSTDTGCSESSHG